MIQAWYLKTEAETQNYFDVDPLKGLDDQSVLARLKKFGANVDPFLSPGLQRVYKVWVKRQGTRQRISLNHLVLGDIVLLESGCRVPADIRLLQVYKLRIDQSILTGEALPATKNTFALNQIEPLNKQKCMAFAGTFVVSGSGWGIVVAHAGKTAQTTALPHKRPKLKIPTGLKPRRLKKLGVIIQNPLAVNELDASDIAFIDIQMPDADILELIRKVQLSHNLACKFLVSAQTADRLKRELPGALVYPVRQLVKHVPKQYLSMAMDAQFITDAPPHELLKVVSTLEQHGSKVLWISDGLTPTPVIKASTVLLIVGDNARDDCIAKAGLIAPKANTAILSRILYNKK